jgi:hypothetical protein
MAPRSTYQTVAQAPPWVAGRSLGRLRTDGPLVSPQGDLDGEAPVAVRGDDQPAVKQVSMKVVVVAPIVTPTRPLASSGMVHTPIQVSRDAGLVFQVEGVDHRHPAASALTIFIHSRRIDARG